MQHLDDGTIHSWLDGALSVDEAARVEAHVKECPECAAGVAEARGFIAGSSRILTALDNAPRGVIPAAAPRKRIDPFVWRVAATVLVVAAGTLVVFQNRGSDERPTTFTDNRAPLMPPPTLEDMTAATAPVTTAPSANGRVGGVSEVAPNAEAVKVPSTLSKSAVVNDRRAVDSTSARRPLRAETGGSAGPPTAVSSDYAKAAAPTAPEVSASLAASGVAMNRAREPDGLKMVGTRRGIGTTVTLYEVVPGDTVTLTEPTMATLGAIVTTGANVAARASRTERAMAPQSVARPDAAAAAAPDSQRGAVLQSTPTSTPTPAPPASVRQVEVANGVTTISWTDATTGNMLKLSGRMSEARLQQIKIRIERERAAAAKKTP
jgi:hypothetical protein